MAKTGHPGGRQGLENTRMHGPIHAKPPAHDDNPPSSTEANASKQPGSISSNRKRSS